MVDGSVADITMLYPLEHLGVGMRAETVSAYLPGVHSEDPRDGGGRPWNLWGIDNILPDPMKEVERSQPEDGEVIVVGAVGAAAPWCLTAWVNNMEVEFMIDTGCQVTILATSVFEQMCAADLQVRSRLRPCGRRLVSADSSPLTGIERSVSETEL